MPPTSSSKSENLSASEQRVPKLCGADVELGNFVLGVDVPQGTGDAASRLLLREVEGIPHASWGSDYGGYSNYGYSSYGCRRGTDDVSPRQKSGGKTSGGKASGWSLSAPGPLNPQDWGRKFLPSNGGCVYIDLSHLELCVPEVLSAYDFVAAWHAMLLIAREAMERANAGLDPPARIQVLVNNSDGQGNAYGGHLNFLMSRRAWHHVFHRKPHYMSYLASYQVSSIVFTGGGKVGAENDAPAVEYQLTQRADFDQVMTGIQTTFDRPLINSRDEPLCGPWRNSYADRHSTEGLARLHVIFYDSNLCHVANLLKCGVMQIVLSMIEAGRVNPALILDDPLEALQIFGHDPTLRARATMASGKRLTAVELQRLFLDELQQFVGSGGCRGVVPQAEAIVTLYADTLEKLHAGDLDALSGRLDWVLKLRLLQRAMSQRPTLSWDSPELKHLDHLYSSLDPGEGLYWICERSGLVERVVGSARIERFVHEPPADTRAYGRAMLLRRAGAERISRIDWDHVSFRLERKSSWPTYRTVDMPDPLGMTAAEVGPLLGSARPFEALLDALLASEGLAAARGGAWNPPAHPACPEYYRLVSDTLVTATPGGLWAPLYAVAGAPAAPSPKPSEATDQSPEKEGGPHYVPSATDQ